MLEGAKSIGAGAATIALAGVAVGIGNVFRSCLHILHTLTYPVSAGIV